MAKQSQTLKTNRSHGSANSNIAKAAANISQQVSPIHPCNVEGCTYVGGSQQSLSKHHGNEHSTIKKKRGRPQLKEKSLEELVEQREKRLEQKKAHYHKYDKAKRQEVMKKDRIIANQLQNNPYNGVKLNHPVNCNGRKMNNLPPPTLMEKLVGTMILAVCQGDPHRIYQNQLLKDELYRLIDRNVDEELSEFGITTAAIAHLSELLRQKLDIGWFRYPPTLNRVKRLFTEDGVVTYAGVYRVIQAGSTNLKTKLRCVTCELDPKYLLEIDRLWKLVDQMEEENSALERELEQYRNPTAVPSEIDVANKRAVLEMMDSWRLKSEIAAGAADQEIEHDYRDHQEDYQQIEIVDNEGLGIWEPQYQQTQSDATNSQTQQMCESAFEQGVRLVEPLFGFAHVPNINTRDQLTKVREFQGNEAAQASYLAMQPSRTKSSKNSARTGLSDERAIPKPPEEEKGPREDPKE